MNWSRLLLRRRRPTTPPRRPGRTVIVGGGGVVSAARATAESRRALDRTRADVDEWTGEIRRLLGG